MKARALLLLAVFVLGACTTPKPRYGKRKDFPTQPRLAHTKLRMKVPFFPDWKDQCGPAVLASVLAYWKTDGADVIAIRDEVYQAPLRGSLSVDLYLAAKDHGMNAEMVEGDLPTIKREL